MRVEIYPRFITQSECDELNAWADQAVIDGKLNHGTAAINGGVDSTRYTSRQSRTRYEYPDLVRDISHRIRRFMGVDKYPLISDHGRDGVVVSVASAGPGVYEHIDPAMPPYGAWPTLRCNILTRAPDSGGLLDIDGIKFPQIGVGDLHCYLVSKYAHSVGPIYGGTARVLWMFGAYVPQGFWEP